MAGHDVDRDSYKILRNSVEPPEALIDQVFPFVKEAIAKITFNQTTALSTLQWLKMIARIVLQDAACMMLSGRTHCIFKFPLFKTPEFKAFLQVMKNKIEAQVTTAEADIRTVLSGVLERIDGINSSQNGMNNNMAELKEEIKKGNDEGLKQTHVAQLFQHMSDFRFDRNMRDRDSEPTINETGQSEEVDPKDVPTCDINCSHTCVSGIVEEWYGVGPYAKEYTNFPEDGGLEMMEKKCRQTWRKHFSSKENKVLSRMRNTIKNIKIISQKTCKPLKEVTDRLVVIMADNHRHNLSAISDHIRDNVDHIVSKLT